MVPVRPVLGQIVQNQPRGANLAFGSIWLSSFYNVVPVPLLN